MPKVREKSERLEFENSATNRSSTWFAHPGLEVEGQQMFKQRDAEEIQQIIQQNAEKGKASQQIEDIETLG